MKQINNLLIYEVPKDANYHAISLGEVCTYHDGVLIDTQSLPPGPTLISNHEIIGVYEKIDHIQMKEVYRAAVKDWAGSIWDWLDMPTDTTDLLFIKKIK